MSTQTMGIYIAVIVALLILSAYFSATETAFTSLNRIRLKNLANDGNKRARLVLDLEEKYDTLLSTILVGNNIAIFNNQHTITKCLYLLHDVC